MTKAQRIFAIDIRLKLCSQSPEKVREKCKRAQEYKQPA
jgi:hypothetical protein